jgi:NTP pyrophosphatase (non-canonical NTP hydrolase)
MDAFEQELEKYLKERDWDNPYPADLAKSVAIETGELLELFQWDRKTAEEVKSDSELRQKIYNELPDIFIYAWQIARALDFDVEQMLMKKLKHVKEKYPAEMIKGHDIDPEKQENYWKIKQGHREEDR